MFGLTTLGVFHTAISLVALIAGIIAFARYKEISSKNLLGQVFLAGTIVSCLTGFGIFQHGGFGKPHVLGIMTLVVLAAALTAEYSSLLGRASRYVATLGYSTAFFFHFVPATAETLTRLPPGAPIAPNADAPQVQMVIGGFFVLYLIGITLQVLRMRAARPAQLGSAT